MKQLLLFLLLLASPILSAQTLESETLAQDIVTTLQGSEAIQVLIKNKRIISSQMEDVRHWTQDSKISPETYGELREAYTNYADHMNNVVDNLSADLRSIESFRDLKGARLNKFIKKFSKTYAEDIGNAYTIYAEDLAPAMETAQFEAGSKGGIIPTLVMVVKFGQSIFTALKDLFTTGKLSDKGERELIAAAMKVTIGSIEKKLKYPSWDEANPFAMSGFSNVTERSISRFNLNPAPVYRSMAGTVGLTTYKTDNSIPLSAATKSIIVGSEAGEESLPMFTVAHPMQNGDRFWVTLEGYEFASFFYYDETQRSWQDPFGKSIIVGQDRSGRMVAKNYLPAPNQFFEIAGTSSGEQFLIVVSNSPMKETHRNLILGNPVHGAEFISQLATLLPNVVPPHEDNASTTSSGIIERIEIQTAGATQQYVPLYIQIHKI